MIRNMLRALLLALALSPAAFAGNMQNPVAARGHIPNGVATPGNMPNEAPADGIIPNDGAAAPASAGTSVFEAALLLLRVALSLP